VNTKADKKAQAKARLTMFWLNNKRTIITLGVSALVAATGTAAAPYVPILINLGCQMAGGCQ